MIRLLKELLTHDLFLVSFSTPFTPENTTISPGSFAEDKYNMASDWHVVKGDIKKAMDIYDNDNGSEKKK